MFAKIKAMFAKIKGKLEGWKTVIFGVGVSIVGFYDMLVATGVDVTPLVPTNSRPVTMALIGVAIIILRLVTSTPVGVKS